MLLLIRLFLMLCCTHALIIGSQTWDVNSATDYQGSLYAEILTEEECPADWIQAGETCYRVLTYDTERPKVLPMQTVPPPADRTWKQARLSCMILGADLVSINSALEDYQLDIIRRRVGVDDTRYFWIGLHDAQQEGIFRWVDGANLTYSRWNIAEPTSHNPSNPRATIENYVIASGNRNWNDVSDDWSAVIGGCQEPHAYICEKPAERPQATDGGPWKVAPLGGARDRQGPRRHPGPKGERGERGEAGVGGGPGPRGERGPPGPAGGHGPPGPEGKAGARGDPGPEGPIGPPGQYLSFDNIVAPSGSPGLPGLQGAPGPPGLHGPPGKEGFPGNPGPPGAEGMEGAAGPRGPRGFPGIHGADGPRGLTGPKGDTGPDGPTGPKGKTGDQGASGTRGLRGLPGLPGVIGPRGSRGPTGSRGPKGDKGDNGHAGPPGLTGLQGLGGPPGPEGPMGQQGTKGHTGVAGPKGDHGLPGQPGAVGPRGPRGPTGLTGPAGVPGPVGPEGQAGRRGVDGIPGRAGRNGLPGTRGMKGARGLPGPVGPPGPPGLSPGLTFIAQEDPGHAQPSSSDGQHNDSWRVKAAFVNATAFCRGRPAGDYEHPLHCWQYVSCGDTYGGDREHTCYSGRRFVLGGPECVQDETCVFGAPSKTVRWSSSKRISAMALRDGRSQFAERSSVDKLRHTHSIYSAGMVVMFLLMAALTVLVCRLYLTTGRDKSTDTVSQDNQHCPSVV